MSDTTGVTYPTSPRSGPCANWVMPADVVNQVAAIDSTVEVPGTWPQIMAGAASEVCYALSARRFTGICGPVTVRPLARPTDIDTRMAYRAAPSGYLNGGMYASAWGTPYSAAVNNYGSSRPPEVELGGFPVQSIESVKIDGVLIPPNEYKLQDRRTLVRMRPSAGAAPTVRYGWPMNQRLDLPDTEVGTFSVTYTYGVPPPQLGWLAAVTLAAQLTLNALDVENSLPLRATTVSRQGVTVAVVDVMDFLKNGDTGIYEVDLFVNTFNPSKQRLPSLVWSPDMGRPRRQ